MTNSCVKSDWCVTSFYIFSINICLQLDMLPNRETKPMTSWKIEPEDFCIVTFCSYFSKFQLDRLKKYCLLIRTIFHLSETGYFTLKVLSKTCILPSSLVTSFFEQQPNNPIVLSLSSLEYLTSSFDTNQIFVCFQFIFTLKFWPQNLTKMLIKSEYHSSRTNCPNPRDKAE